MYIVRFSYDLLLFLIPFPQVRLLDFIRNPGTDILGSRRFSGMPRAGLTGGASGRRCLNAKEDKSANRRKF